MPDKTATTLSVVSSVWITVVISVGFVLFITGAVLTAKNRSWRDTTAVIDSVDACTNATCNLQVRYLGYDNTEYSTPLSVLAAPSSPYKAGALLRIRHDADDAKRVKIGSKWEWMVGLVLLPVGCVIMAGSIVGFFLMIKMCVRKCESK
jgi:hypothetical protein